MKKARRSIPSPFKKLLQKEIGSVCPFCANEDVHHFEVHHIDSDRSNNEFINLLMLCPICHSKITKGEIAEIEVLKKKVSLFDAKIGKVFDFPGTELAKAWVYTVLNQLIFATAHQLKYLIDKDWGFDRFHQGELKRIVEFIPTNISGNYEQFFQCRTDIFEVLQRHDEKVRSLAAVTKASHSRIVRNPELRKLFKRLTSLDALIQLKDPSIPNQYYEFREVRTENEFLKKLFGSMTADDIMQLVAELLINNPEPPIYDNNFAPWWNLHYAELMSVRGSIFNQDVSRIQDEGTELLEIVQELSVALKASRDGFCYKYRFPPEEPLPPVTLTPSFRHRYGQF